MALAASKSVIAGARALPISSPTWAASRRLSTASIESINRAITSAAIAVGRRESEQRQSAHLGKVSHERPRSLCDRLRRGRRGQAVRARRQPREARADRQLLRMRDPSSRAAVSRTPERAFELSRFRARGFRYNNRDNTDIFGTAIAGCWRSESIFGLHRCRSERVDSVCRMEFNFISGMHSRQAEPTIPRKPF